MCPFRSRSLTHIHSLALAVSSLDAILNYLQCLSEEPSIMTHRLSTLSRLYIRSWDATLWRALTGSFYDALIKMEPRVLRNQWLNKKKNISISQLDLGVDIDIVTLTWFRRLYKTFYKRNIIIGIIWIFYIFTYETLYQIIFFVVLN